MSLYYEDAPADENEPPQLPPLLTPIAVAEGQDVLAKALSSATTADVGTVFYSEAVNVMEVAIVLGPEVPLRQSGQILYALMIGLGDAIGALAPRKSSSHTNSPAIFCNRGRAGAVQLLPTRQLGAKMAGLACCCGYAGSVGPHGKRRCRRDPVGLGHTSLAEKEEVISRTRLVESACRHFMAWVDRWQDDGFKPLHDLWVQRLQSDGEMILSDGSVADWVGLDEDGAALIRLDGRPVGLLPNEFESVCGPVELVSLKG